MHRLDPGLYSHANFLGHYEEMKRASDEELERGG